MFESEIQTAETEVAPEPRRIRKCYRLCQAVLKNAAYYSGGASLSVSAQPKSQFAVVASNNFLDMAFLDWSKLFWDRQGLHRWNKILPSSTSFMDRVLVALGMDADQFAAFAKSVAHYRDKELAHADVYEVIDIPALAAIIESTILLYESLRSECGKEPSPSAPHDLRATFQLEVDHSRTHFVALSKVPT
jgi:hypothetical protein